MPLHPLVVHFPIVLLLVATLFELVNLFVKKDYLGKSSTILYVLGVISGLVTLTTGDPAEEFAYDKWGQGIHDTVELHSTLANVSVILFAIVAVVKLFGKLVKMNKTLITALVIVFSLAGSTTLAITGHLGGKIAYLHDQLTSKTTGDTETGDGDADAH